MVKGKNPANVEILTNISRIITTLEKTLKQIARKNYNHRSQYPEIFFEIESYLNAMHFWIKEYGNFCSVPAFIGLSMIYLEEIFPLINELLILCSPVKGRRREKKKTRLKQYEKFRKSVGGMLKHIKEYLGELKSEQGPIGIEIEAALFKAFEKHCSAIHKKDEGLSVSMRGNKTYIFACQDKDDYLVLINDTKRFRSEVVDKLGAYAHSTGHAPFCQSKEKYRLRGFRSKPRKVVMEGGKQEIYPIRVIECTSCGQKFSVLPSFLPREKHFGMDMIGNIVRGLVLSGHGFRDSYENFKLTGSKLKSCQTILNWLQWFGIHHPATLLTRAGVKGQYC